MKNKHIYIKSLFALCLVFVLSVNVFCASSITDAQTYLTFFENPAMNSRVLNSYTSALPAEKKEFIKTCIPIIAQKMGLPSALSSYTVLNLFYQNPRSIVISHYGTDSDAFNRFLHDYRLNFDKSAGAVSDLSAKGNRDLIMKFEPSFLGNDTDGFYTDLGEYCVKTLYHDDSSNQIVGGRDFTTNFYNLADYIADEKVGESGVVQREIYSFRNLKASDFYNDSVLTDDFYNICKNNKAKKWALIGVQRGYSGGVNNWNLYYLLIPKNPYNIFINGTNNTPTETNIQLIDNSGVVHMNISDFDLYYGWTSNHGFTTECPSAVTFYAIKNLTFTLQGATNTADIISWSTSTSGATYSKPMTILSLNDTQSTYNLFTTLNGYHDNNNGEWVNPYVMPNYIAPSVTYGAQDMSRTYTSIVSGSNNTTTNNYFGDSIVYPDKFVPDDTNGYDSETNSLKFGSITDFLKSIGNFLGSIINGIAGGLANIFNALSTITQNILNLINQGFMGFMSALFGWLPAEIVAVISGGIVLIVLFGIIKVIRG